MKTCRYLVICLALILCGKLQAQKDLEQLMRSRGEYYFTLTVQQPAEIQAISNLCSVAQTDGKTVVCYANQNEYDQLLMLGYQPQLQTPPSMLEEPIMWDGSNRAEYDWDAYPTYETYENMMWQFAAEHPNRCTYIELGTLDSGRKLMFCRINNGQPEGKPKFLYTSTMHGDETTGFMLMLRLIDELCTSNDARILNLVNNLDIFICPNTNPDGTYYGGNHTVYGARRNNANDIDLNRHYPDFVSGPHPDGNWCYQDETQWLINLAKDFSFTMAANFHTGSEVVNYPWDNLTQLSADDAWWEMVCHEYADLVHEACHATEPNYMTDYNDGIVRGCVWYMISGGRQDYMNYYAQCREVTIECSRVYTPNAGQMPKYWNFNHNSMLRYMEQCLNGIHGTVTDAVTGEPIEATISIAGHDNHGSEVSSHLPAGDYHRPIKGGTYNVTYSAYGYDSQTVTITVNDNQAVTQDIQLNPIPNTPLVADFDVEKELLTVGAHIRFDDLTKGRNIVSWNWQFEGGTPTVSTQRNPVIAYGTPGLFDVTLTVTDAQGQTSTITKEQLVDVYHAIPIHDGEATVTDCKALFLPSGGDCGHYANNESYKMTLYPEDNDRKLIVNFLVFNTQPNADVLSIYDGTTTNAPLIGSFSGSELPDSITASNPRGALTFTFFSNDYTNFSGWVATLTCTGGTSVEENDTESINVFPNPCENRFTIEAKGRCEYTLYNSLGQRMLSGTFSDKTQIETTAMQRGLYFLRLHHESGNKVEKLIIEK